MPAPHELYELDLIQRQAREVLARRSLRVDVRERWEAIRHRAEWCVDMITKHCDRCDHCLGGGRISRPMLKDNAGHELRWPTGYPRQISCPYCRGGGLVDRPDADGDVAQWVSR